MKIIKPGKLPSSRTHVTFCNNCGCKFRFAESEAKYYSDQRDGDAWVVKCPQRGCGEEVWVGV